MRQADLVGMGKRGREAMETRFDRPIAARTHLDELESLAETGIVDTLGNHVVEKGLPSTRNGALARGSVSA